MDFHYSMSLHCPWTLFWPASVWVVSWNVRLSGLKLQMRLVCHSTGLVTGEYKMLYASSLGFWSTRYSFYWMFPPQNWPREAAEVHLWTHRISFQSFLSLVGTCSSPPSNSSRAYSGPGQISSGKDKKKSANMPWSGGHCHPTLFLLSTGLWLKGTFVSEETVNQFGGTICKQSGEMNVSSTCTSCCPQAGLWAAGGWAIFGSSLKAERSQVPPKCTFLIIHVLLIAAVMMSGK